MNYQQTLRKHSGSILGSSREKLDGQLLNVVIENKRPLAGQTNQIGFSIPLMALAGPPEPGGIALGFFPHLCDSLHRSLFDSMDVVAVLSQFSTPIHPSIGGLRDVGHVSTGADMVVGSVLIAATSPPAR
jgi:hypothetical protein